MYGTCASLVSVFYFRVEAGGAYEIPHSLHEVEVPRLQYALPLQAGSNSGALRGRLRRYMHRCTPEVSGLRSRSASSRLHTQNHPRSIRFRRSQSSHNEASMMNFDKLFGSP